MKLSFRLGLTRRWCHMEVFEGVKVHKDMVAFVEEAVVPGSGLEAADVWKGLGIVCSTMHAKNRELLDIRDSIQAKIDDYYRKNKGKPLNQAEYKQFLESIGYLVPRGGDFKVQTLNTDPELASIPAPQLVCPVDNARYIVNAANARWGSLLDALYGTDVIPGIPTGGYDPARGALVFQEVHSILDKIFPLKGQSWGDLTDIAVTSGALNVPLANPSAFVGYNEKNGTTSSVLLKNNGLHIEICVNKAHPIGKSHKAGIYDVQVEAALSVLADAEDSACTVDVSDKIVAYRNWTGLMDQTLSIPMEKNGKSFDRMLNAARSFKTPQGGNLVLNGKAVLMCRNVGLHMYTDIVKTNGQDTPEQFLDAVVTVLAGLHDLKTDSNSNSKARSIYLVKPKMHGPDEVRFVDEMFTKVEEALKIPKNTVKIGIMDEERRMSVNLKEALRVAKDRVFFINTGFLDRVADEIHTSMEAGPMLPKEEIRHVEWMKAYEASNVDRGLETDLVGKGQIGKGMWAAPDNMAEMMVKKIGHLEQGATTAWCPSPTAATLHALHYHYYDVLKSHDQLRKGIQDRTDSILKPPLLDRELSAEDIQNELDCNCQSLLGYVVRWVGLGVGCSKVPDTHDVQLMEDRATLRISSQHIANWLRHGLVTEKQVVTTMKKMAAVVDKQNAEDPLYIPMGPSYDTVEFKAAYDLIFKGTQSPNGYTEDILSSRRRERKALDKAASA
eukprot:TRINITY_DN33328_c0_g1_i1.p1 TRINITY_DN33328_c0_g1~~TRINITY_DN33328_c0_g1_i1.p1  ORF type:complete len:744 (+),score=311.82 TRINITY_DN33328_c0_g1_i1:58-2232(+)